MTSALAFLVTIGVLVVVHEWGHYRVARACGIDVLRFSVGFGRVLWRWQKNASSTEFMLCLLPIGGYVRMLDSREQAVAPDRLHRAFDQRPLFQRSLVVIAGPAANLLLAVALYAAAGWAGLHEPLALLGSPVPASLADTGGQRAGDRVHEVCPALHRGLGSPDPFAQGDCVPVRSMSHLRWLVTQSALESQDLELRVNNSLLREEARRSLDLSTLKGQELDAALWQKVGLGSAYSRPVLGSLQAGGPAERAGLRAGDLVLRTDGRALEDAAQLRERIRASLRDGQPQAMQWLVQRGGEELEFEVMPRLHQGDAQRTAVARIDAALGEPPQSTLVRLGFLEGWAEGLERTLDVSVMTVKMAGRMVIGEASLRNLSGPLTIADAAGHSAQQGLSHYLGFLALVSISLGVLNLLPLPMLDGGHLMYHLFEAVSGRPISELWMVRLQRVGLALILLLMALALSNDVARLLAPN